MEQKSVMLLLYDQTIIVKHLNLISKLLKI